MSITIKHKPVRGYLGRVWAVEDEGGRVLFVESTKKAAQFTLDHAQTCPSCARLVREGQFLCPDCHSLMPAYSDYMEREREKGLPTND